MCTKFQWKKKKPSLYAVDYFVNFAQPGISKSKKYVETMIFFYSFVRRIKLNNLNVKQEVQLCSGRSRNLPVSRRAYSSLQHVTLVWTRLSTVDGEHIYIQGLLKPLKRLGTANVFNISDHSDLYIKVHITTY